MLRPQRGDSWTTGEQVDIKYVVHREWNVPNGSVQLLINGKPAAEAPLTPFPYSLILPPIPIGTYELEFWLMDGARRPTGITASAKIVVSAPLPAPPITAVGIDVLAPTRREIMYVNEKANFRIAMHGVDVGSIVHARIDGLYHKELVVPAAQVGSTVPASEIGWEEDVRDWSLGLFQCRANHVFCPGVHVATLSVGSFSVSFSFVIVATESLVPFSCSAYTTREQHADSTVVGTGDGLWGEAAFCYARAIALRPASDVLWAKAAQVARFRGEAPIAARSYRVLLRLDEATRTAREGIAALRSLGAAAAHEWAAPRASPMAGKPYLSIVMTNRYDDSVLCQGPTPATCIARHRASMQAWLFLLATHKLDAEIVLVDYNPVPGMPTMSELMAPLLEFGGGSTTAVRIITVPNELHRAVPNPGNVQVLVIRI